MNNDNESKFSSESIIIDLIDILITDRLYQKLPIINKFRKMTYDNAISFFVNNKPPQSLPFDKGVMLLDKEGNQTFFTQVYLDENNNVISNPVTNIPYGRRCLIRDMDNELIGLFGNKKIIIVK